MLRTYVYERTCVLPTCDLSLKYMYPLCYDPKRSKWLWHYYFLDLTHAVSSYLIIIIYYNDIRNEEENSPRQVANLVSTAPIYCKQSYIHI